MLQSLKRIGLHVVAGDPNIHEISTSVSLQI